MMLERNKTILLHTSLSALVVGSLVAVIFLVWYPSPYFRISGADSALWTLIGVDLVLGPLLTVYLYKPGKKGLWFDMWSIAAIQVGALIYGGGILYDQRPQYVVFSVDRFAVLPEPDLVHDGGPIAACAGSAAPPCVAVAIPPEDLDTRNALLVASLEQGIELEQQPEFWQALSEQSAVVLDKARRLETLASGSPQSQAALSRVLERSGRDAESLRWVPVINKRLDAFTLVIDAQTAEPVDVVDIDPWDGDA